MLTIFVSQIIFSEFYCDSIFFLKVVKCAIYYHKTHKNRLSKSALKKLPVRKYQKSDKYDTCPICLDEYEESVKIRILPCEHGL